MTPLEIVATAFIAVGTFFGFVATVGIIRLPDLYSRLHAASKSDTLGTILTLAGVALTFHSTVPWVKLALLALFMLITTPTATHAITRAAYDQGIEPWTVEDGGDAE